MFTHAMSPGQVALAVGAWGLARLVEGRDCNLGESGLQQLCM